MTPQCAHRALTIIGLLHKILKALRFFSSNSDSLKVCLVPARQVGVLNPVLQKKKKPNQKTVAIGWLDYNVWFLEI